MLALPFLSVLASQWREMAARLAAWCRPNITLSPPRLRGDGRDGCSSWIFPREGDEEGQRWPLVLVVGIRATSSLNSG